MTKNFKRHVAIMLSTLILLGGNGQVLADDRGNDPNGNSSGNSVEASISEEEILPWDGSLEESVYYGNGFKVEFNLKEHWDTGYNANVKITNTSITSLK